MPIHQVGQGECLSSIADTYGVNWKTIWQHARNADLRRRRGDPNVLAPGDELFIPDKTAKEVAGATERRHRFVKKGVPAQLRLRILSDDAPRANVRYTLRVDGRLIQTGNTDADGYVTASIPPDARTGTLVIEENGCADIYPFDFGHLDPIDTEDGVRGRLRNLGYSADEDLAAAVRAFQAKEGIDPTGEIDDETRRRLKERFGE